jgi:hypothetical protein
VVQKRKQTNNLQEKKDGADLSFKASKKVTISMLADLTSESIDKLIKKQKESA